MSQPFSKFRKAVNLSKKVTPYIGTVLALDPGETTGWSVFYSSQDDVVLHAQGQEKTYPMENCVNGLTNLIDIYKPTIIVHELYSVYEWKTDEHAWSTVPTLRVIGCLETLCIQRKLPYITQTAQIAKNFCTDEKLKTWNYYIKGARHARDSIRHGTYFLMFGHQEKSN